MARPRTRIARGDGNNADNLPDNGEDRLDLGGDVALVGDPGDGVVAVEGGDNDQNWDLPEEVRNQTQAENGKKPTNGNNGEAEPEHDQNQYDEEDSRLAYSDTGEEDTPPRGMSHRQRRNQRRRMYQQAQNQENDQLRNQVAELTRVVQGLASGQQGLAASGLEGQIRTLQSQLGMVDQEMADAVKNSDGDTYKRAQDLRDKIVGRIYVMQAQHARMTETREGQDDRQTQQRQSPQERQQQQTQQVDPRVAQKFDRFLERYDWFDPESTDANANIVRAIDAELIGEGYQRHQSLFWQQLEKRLADYNIHPSNMGGDGQDDEFRDERPVRQPSQQQRGTMQRQHPPTSNGRSSGNGRSNGFRLSEMQVNILREEGLIDDKLSDEDKAKRDRIINKWKSGAQQQRRGGAVQ